MNSLTPHAFISPEALRQRIKRVAGAEDDVEERLVGAVNAATHWMEMLTRRKLKARNHRTAVTVTASAASGATAFTGSDTTSLEVGDDVVGTGIAPGTQLASITSASAGTLTRSTTAAITGGSLTFGSLPLRFSGDGDREAYLCERPLVEVFSLYYQDSDGTLTAIDTTGARYAYETGRIYLPSDVFPRGTLNIVANARCGYEQPSATSLGHSEWFQLEAIAYRAAEVFYTDGVNLRGRVDSVGVGGASAQFNSAPMPADLIAALLPFVRRW